MKDPETVRKESTELCTACGLCAAACPPYSHRTVQIPDREVQAQVREFLDGRPPTNAVLERSRLCNECYLCVTETCPRGLDPMRTNQLLRSLLHAQGIDPRPFTPPSDPRSFERVAAALLTTEEEYRRITTPAVKGDGRILFFPGCNIYYQPNLLLTIMDILDLIADDWTFLPGLDHCCGSNHDSAGRLQAGKKSLEALALSMGKAGFESAVVWCSTCAARLHLAGFDLPVISFARLAADRLGSPLAGMQLEGGVAVHDPCKNAYLGLDTEAPRTLLKMATGAPVREMPRHGRDTVCCGWALLEHLPDVGDEHLKDRLAEAEAAGAGTLATVCHGCQWIMDRPRYGTGVKVVSYIRLVGEALGIVHRERFRELRGMESPEAAVRSVRKRMGGRFEALPFDARRVRETIKILMGGSYGT